MLKQLKLTQPMNEREQTKLPEREREQTTNEREQGT